MQRNEIFWMMSKVEPDSYSCLPFGQQYKNTKPGRAPKDVYSSVRISASSVNLPSDWRVLCEPAVSAGSASGRTTAGSPGQVTFLVIHDNLFLLTLNTYSARYE
ncbi:hypothetical protein Bbelb_433310 [Branchiostoma belcheri]|nr:hypothetical protein Bbelb_434840 [Branchiostoma belcheri]KAI8478933.1 hypothetical protein Bbelb_433310 [Branchiostoma belcheri]